MASNSGGIGVFVAFGLVALAYANGGCESLGAPRAGGGAGDGSFDVSVADDDVVAADGLASCDGVVVVESASGTAEIPGDTGVLGMSGSSACEMGPGRADEEAVAALQTALAGCNGHAVAIDGEYGPRTTAAVRAVQRQAGIAEDGVYGPVTQRAMHWPATATTGTTDCVGGMTQIAVYEAS